MNVVRHRLLGVEGVNEGGMRMPVFVLVHGTGHGGWCWQKVVPILRRSGADAYAQTLTGVSDRSHLLDCGVDLTTHIMDVGNLLVYEDLSDVVLVGHSYGGMVISGVAATAPERLRQLIYLDAYVPSAGESEVDLWPSEMRAEIESDATAHSGLRPPPSPEFMGITDPALVDWVRERITAHPMATYTEAVPPGSARSNALARAYISCTEGPLTPVFEPFAEKAREAGWPVREIPTGHDAMLTAPETLAELLLELSDTAEAG
jgi:pimeloyl-ACP methyl ester carboxylesterase